MRGLAALLAFVAGPAAALDGLYQPQGYAWSCRAEAVGMDGGALEIRDGMLRGVESACALTNPVSVRAMNATLYDAECHGEGEAYGYRVMLMPRADGVYVITDGHVAEWERCGP